MSEPTIAEQIAALPAAERALVEALVRRLAVLVTPAPARRRRRTPPLPEVAPDVEARVLRELAAIGLAPRSS